MDMETKKLLIKNGTLVNSHKSYKSDILIEDGKIKEIAPQINDESIKIIDANNLHVIPGAIDPQVHFREPGLTHKEDIHSGSRAAVAGGITTFFEMPNTNPSTISVELLNQKNEIARNTSVANYSFFIGATHHNIEEIKKINNNCGIKIFMGSSTGNLLVDDETALENIFAHATRVVAVHAEDEDILNEIAQKIKPAKFSDHVKMRPVEAAVTATKKAIKYALKYNKKLHVLHISTAEEVEIIRQHKAPNLITAETTPQHLLLEAPDIYDRIGSLGMMNPPIREKYHQDELWKGLRDGTIQCIATDHAPHTLEEKNNPYEKSPAGMPGVETSLPLMLNQVNKGAIELTDVVKWMCENVTKIYGIKNKGFIKTGYDADITIIDMNKEKAVLGSNMQSKCGWSAFDNQKLKGWPITTIVNGNVVFENETVSTQFLGKPVLFNE